jgi:hypothetical protein
VNRVDEAANYRLGQCISIGPREIKDSQRAWENHMASLQEQDGRARSKRSGSPPMSDVRACRLVVRCLLERYDDRWEAYTLEFGLAAQAESEQDVRRKLENMIECYVRDALVGEDREHAYELLRRRARWQIYARYYLARAAKQFAWLHTGSVPYREPLALEPRHCTA